MPAPRPSLLTKLFRRTPTTIRNPKPVPRTQLGLTTLEDRLVPAASLTATLNMAEGVLWVEGTDDADQIRIAHQDGSVSVAGIQITLTDLDGNVSDVNAVDSNWVGWSQVDALGGDDIVIIDDSGVVNDNLFGVNVYGGDGNDWLQGVRGTVALFGQAGNDSLYGGEGDDLVYGGEGDDVISGGNGNDYLAGEWDNDTVNGDAGDDILDGGDGDDALYGGPDTDQLAGGAGVNTYPDAAGLDLVTDPVLTANWSMAQVVRDEWAALGGADGFLGQPTADDAAAPGGGRVATFTGGSILYTSPADAHAVSAAIQLKYAALGGAGGFLGQPTADETDAPNGGRVAVFQGGTIYWSPATGATGAHEVHGSILEKYNALGGPGGFVGYPTTDELAVPGGRVSRFQGADIYSSGATGRHEVHGTIRIKYNALGGVSFLGLPTSDELPAAQGGHVSHFQVGDIYATGATGAHEVHGTILEKYNALGGPGGFVGYPTTDELAVPGGRVSRFQGADIYSNAAAGRHEVRGTIRDRYNALGGPAGLLGFPTADQWAVSGGSYNSFQNGVIYASPATGAHEIHGPILTKWSSLGWERGLLGFPKTDVFIGSGGWQVSIFENGEIIWRADAGVHLMFNRNEVIGAIKKSEIDGWLDTSEFSFLHGIGVDPAIYVPDAVRNLTRKLIDGDVANARSRVGVNPLDSVHVDNPVGNLSVGAPAWKVDMLEKKWFEGQDRPHTARALTFWEVLSGAPSIFAYARVEGDLFGPTGPDIQDIKQGADGDCYFMAALGGVALKHPEVIRNMFTDNGDGTFTVRFFRNGQPEYVTVDRFAPVYASGRLVYAGSGRAATLPAGASPAQNPVWAILAEKAYAQINQSGWIGQDGTNSYNGIPASFDGGINGGSGYYALAQITGLTPSTVSGISCALFARTAFDAGKVVLVSTPATVNVPELAGNHVYVLLQATNDGVVVANPWGNNNIGGVFVTYLTWSQFNSNFNWVDYV